MVIVWLGGGLGNQIYEYVLGKYLAHKLNTELKLDLGYTQLLSSFQNEKAHPNLYFAYYRLGDFNIQEDFATPEEIKRVRKNGVMLDSFQAFQDLMSNLENFHGDIYAYGTWQHSERYFIDIMDTLRKEFTLKKPLSSNAMAWKEKILSSECSVFMHFRHGDYAYNPNFLRNNIKDKSWLAIVPLDYYYTCIDILKQRYNNLTVFCFSNNLPWVKENLHLDVPTEFVEGCDSDLEEFILMTLCKHSIIPYSTFSMCAATLNSNPDRKIFQSQPSTAENVQKYVDSLTPSKKESILNSGRWIMVPFDFYNQPEITQRPIFSLLLVVNDDASTISETLDSILNQDYKYCEIVIVDNASTDGSGKICRQAIEGRDNVTFKRLSSKVPNAKAWNKAFTWAEGYYVSFLKGNDRFLYDTLSSLYLIGISRRVANIVHLSSWLEEDDNGTVIFDDKKYSEKRDAFFQKQMKSLLTKNGQEAAKLLVNKQINRFLGTKIYNKEFLSENKIKFDEQLTDNEAELFFQMECFFKTKRFAYAPNALYIVPKKYSMPMANLLYVASNEVSRYLTARIDIWFSSRTDEENFKILSVSDDIAHISKPDWFNQNGIGYVITSYFGKLDIVAKATTDGQVRLSFMGLDIRSPEDFSKRIPQWIDYTKLTINGNLIFDKLTPTWHDKPYRHVMDVKAGDEITVEVEWLPHRSDT